MGLKQKLQNEFLLNGKMTRDECRKFARVNGFDEANADRQLRRLSSGENAILERVKNEDGYIVAYKAREALNRSFEPQGAFKSVVDELNYMSEQMKREKEAKKGMF